MQGESLRQTRRSQSAFSIPSAQAGQDYMLLQHRSASHVPDRVESNFFFNGGYFEMPPSM